MIREFVDTAFHRFGTASIGSRRKRLSPRVGALATVVALHIIAAFVLVLDFSSSAEPKWMDAGGEATDIVGFSQAAMQAPSRDARQDNQPNDELKDLLSAQHTDSPKPAPDRNPSASLDDLLGTFPSGTKAEATNPTSGSAPPAGSAKRMTALKPGESLRMVDIFDAASLPQVGSPPKAPLPDLWRHVRSCWRPIAAASVELNIELANGRLVAQPVAIRAGSTGPAAELAERAAARAVEVCAPYGRQFSGRWRISFPALP